MFGEKLFLLDSIEVEDKQLFPIVSLKFLSVKNTFLNIDYEIKAFKIIENNEMYFININASKLEFINIEKIFKKK